MGQPLRSTWCATAILLTACGASTPASVRVGRTEAPDTVEVGADLFARVNAERARHGLPALEADPLLDRVALAHSEDMRDARFIGHDSPSRGSPADRVEHAGLGRMTVLENVARGVDGEALWKSFQTVSQRENMRNAQATHTGIGIAVERGEEGWMLYATQVFAQLAHEIDVAAAPARVRGWIEATRRKRGLPVPMQDTKLDEVAAQAALEFFAVPAPGEGEIVARANQKLSTLGGGYRKAGTVAAIVRLLEESVGLEPSLDPDAKAIGIGVAQGARPGKGPLAVAIVVIWAK